MKLRNKLILSCAALAAVATTAVSTTYAWYTQNTEVTAKGVTGTTQTSDQSVLMISKDDYNWGSKVDLNLASLNLVPVERIVTDTYTEAEGITADNYAAKKANLFVDGATEGTYDAAGENFDADETYYTKKAAGFYAWNQGENVADVAATQNVDYFAFDLYFKSGTTDSLNVYVKKFDLVNTTAATGLPSKIKLNNTGLPVAETTYTVDMFRALTIDQITGSTKELLAQDGTIADCTNVETIVWDAQSLAGSDSLGSEFNAHAYYNAVKGLYEINYDEVASPKAADIATYYELVGGVYVKTLDEEIDADKTYYVVGDVTPAGIDETKTNSETTRSNLKNTSAQGYDPLHATNGWKLGVTGAGSTNAAQASDVLKVTFIIYLDGWDLACFDACQGQNFTLDMEFVSNKVGA